MVASPSRKWRPCKKEVWWLAIPVVANLSSLFSHENTQQVLLVLHIHWCFILYSSQIMPSRVRDWRKRCVHVLCCKFNFDFEFIVSKQLTCMVLVAPERVYDSDFEGLLSHAHFLPSFTFSSSLSSPSPAGKWPPVGKDDKPSVYVQWCAVNCSGRENMFNSCCDGKVIIDTYVYECL